MANGNGAKADVLKRSVTRADHPDSPRSGVYRFQFPAMLEFETALPRYGTIYRDRYLRYSTLRESQWASAVHIAQTKVASLDAEITGETDGTRLKHWQELWVQVDRNQSPSAYLQKGVRDFLTTNNGQFIEIVRATQGQGSRIIGLVHLDSLRCRRTGDEDVPVIYTDLMGVEHELRDYQVIMLADDPDPGEQYFGMGHCAAERAYHTIMRLSGIEVYVTEKVTGQRPLAIYIVNGNVDEQMLIDGLATAKDMRQEQGYTQYMGAVIIPIVDPTATPNVAVIPLAELPDGFDPEAERKRADLVYANALGIDPQEVNPDLLASRAMGTGAQSRVIEEKEAGKGLVTWRKTFPHLLNQYVYPERVTFAFSERDLRDEQAKAELALTRAQARGQMITNGEITNVEARNLAVDADDLPREYLREDVTPQETVTDSEKLPSGETPQVQTPPMRYLTEQDLRAAAQQAQATKERDYPPALQSLITQAELDIQQATESLRRRELTVEEWRTRIADIIFNFHTQAYRAGARAGERELTPGEQRLIELQAQEQVAYLTRFANEIEGSTEWQETWANRAGMYANSIGASYWNGRTRELPLPAQPMDGTTQCISNCKCKWRVEWLDQEKGDADAYWEWEPTAEHCQTCIERHQQWYPLHIRGGVLLP